MSARQVLQEVSVLGLVKNGKPLSYQTFVKLLRNPIYCGVVKSPKLNFEGMGDFKPIVSRETWDAAQRAVDDRRRGNTKKRKWDHPDFPLRRIVRCESCGGPLTGSWSKGRNGRYGYYWCYRKGCVSIRKEMLEDAVADVVSKLSLPKPTLQLLEAVVRDVWAQKQEHDLQQSKLVAMEHSKLQSRLDKLFQKHVFDETVDGPTYKQQRALIEAQIQDLRELTPALPQDDEIEAAVARASNLLTDLGAYWNQVRAQGRPRFVKTVFPAGLTCSAEGIGTAKRPILAYDKASPSLSRRLW